MNYIFILVWVLEEQLEEKIIHTTEMITESYQTCLEIYQTRKVELKLNFSLKIY